MSWAERLADRVAAVIGSWRFIIIQSIVLLCWVTLNGLKIVDFDEYPFILLNLFLSFQAAYTGPVLLMAANRQAAVDRKRAMKNLIIDQQDHEVIIKLERHLDDHFHKLMNQLKCAHCLSNVSTSDNQPLPQHPKSTEETLDQPRQDQKST